jgi:hypothetical protein
MTTQMKNLISMWLPLTLTAVAACSSNGGQTGDAGTGGAGGSADGGPFALQPFAAPPANPPAKSILFAASGEALAFSGYAFPPAADGDAAFVDGWEVRFDRLLVTIDKIRLSSNPDMVPTDQSKTGALVAEADGPWAVDLHPQGALPGKGGGDETAVPIAFLANQNKNGNAAFDTAAGTRYAFGFDVVPATATAQNVNLDAAALASYQQMAADGCAVFYEGTATFKGVTCTPPDPEFGRLPPAVKFSLCFKSPSSYINCQNPDNGASTFNGEEFIRGIALQDNAAVIGQVTIHTDHPFWESTIHDSPAHFDQFAAQATGATGTPTVTMADVVGVNYLAFADKQGNALPWRTCLPTATYPMSGYQAPAGQMHFDAQTIAKIAATADPTTGFRDYADFATYNQSTQGHLNSDGLCVVKHNPPYLAPN